MRLLVVRFGDFNCYNKVVKKRNMIAVSIFIGFYVLFGIHLTLSQEKLIYYPSPQDFETCVSFSDVEKISYKGTRMYVDLKGDYVVVVYHGNAGSACHRDYLAREINKAGHGYIVVEYAGYSNDSLKPSHKRIRQDVKNVIEYLEHQDVSNIILLGESIGVGVASYHASIKSPSRMILISAFASLKDLARRHFWYYPTFLMVNDVYDNVDLLKEYKGKIVILHGDKDSIIPQASSIKLKESLTTDNITYVSLSGLGHNDLFSSQETYQALQDALTIKE